MLAALKQVMVFFLYICLYFAHVHEGMLCVSDLILFYCVTRCWPEHNDWTQYTDRGISNSSLWLPAYTIIPAIASTDLLKDNDLWFHGTRCLAWLSMHILFSILVPHIAKGRHCGPELESLSLLQMRLCFLLIKWSQ